MPDLFSKTQRDKIKTLYTDMFDTFNKPCKLYYPPLITPCSACLSLAGNDYQGNVGVYGNNLGNFNNCSYCGGNGQIEQEMTETINLICDWTPKNFQNLFQNVNINSASLITKGKMADIIKVKKCIYMIINAKLDSLINNKYKLSGENQDQYCIIQDGWFFQVWESA